MDRRVDVDPALWGEFHRVVNTSSRELSEWLRPCSAGEGTEELPDRAGTQTGRAVLRILQKRRVDLDDGRPTEPRIRPKQSAAFVDSDFKNGYRRPGKLTGRRAIVTGGESGVGRVVATTVAREGAGV